MIKAKAEAIVGLKSEKKEETPKKSEEGEEKSTKTEEK